MRKFIDILAFPADLVLCGLFAMSAMFTAVFEQLLELRKFEHKALKAICSVLVVAGIVRVGIDVYARRSVLPREGIERVAVSFPEGSEVPRREKTFSAGVVVTKDGRTISDQSVVWFYGDNTWYASMLEGTEVKKVSAYVTEQELLEDIRERYPRLPVDDLVSR